MINPNSAKPVRNNWKQALPDGGSGMRRAIFLDRDGTVNKEVNYLSDPADFELLPGAADTIAQWNAQGWVVVLVTNQSGVGRGYFTLDAVHAIHDLMINQLNQAGARVDGIYLCPHHPEAGCLCRKPGTALFEKAASDLSLDLASSYFIGDKLSDLLPARKFEARPVLVRTGHGREHVDAVSESLLSGVWIVDDLPAAARRMDLPGASKDNARAS